MRRVILTRRQNLKRLCILGIFLYAAFVQLSAVAASNNGFFKSYPSIVSLPIGARITFEVAKSTDVELSVLDSKDRVIRHLAAGVLGGEFVPPMPLQKGMRQSVEWDGRDDFGKPATGGPSLEIVSRESYLAGRGWDGRHYLLIRKGRKCAKDNKK